MDTETKTAANGISWKGDTHMGADYLVGKAVNGDIYEVYFNPNSNPTPCSWVNYGPDGDTGPNSGIAQGQGFATMQEAMKAAEENAMGKTAKTAHAPDSGQQCPSCRQYEVHVYDDNGRYAYCSNCDWSDRPDLAHGEIVHHDTDLDHFMNGSLQHEGREDPRAKHRYTYGDDDVSSAGHSQPMEFECSSCHHRFHGTGPKNCPNCGGPATGHKVVGAKGSLPEHLQEYWGKMTVDPRDNPNFCAKQSHKTPAIPWHNGMPTCLSCGKKATFNAGTGVVRYSSQARRSAKVEPEGDRHRWTIMAGDLKAMTGTTATREEAEDVWRSFASISPEPLAAKALLANYYASVDHAYLWHLLPVGLSIEAAFFSPDSVAPVSSPEDGPKAITVDHAKHQQARMDEANQTLEQRGTPTIAPTTPPVASEVTSNLNTPTIATVKRAVNEQAFGSERYQTLDRDFPSTGWAGSDGFDADHGPAAHNRPLPANYQITGWPSAWGQGSPLAPSEGSRTVTAGEEACDSTDEFGGHCVYRKGHDMTQFTHRYEGGDENARYRKSLEQYWHEHSGTTPGFPRQSAATGWLAAARNVVATNSYATVDGMVLDLFSASVMVQVYDGLSDANKAKFEAMSLPAAHDLAFKIVDRAKTAAFFDTDQAGVEPAGSADGGSSVPMSTRPQVSPSAPEATSDPLDANPAENMVAPTSADPGMNAGPATAGPSAFEQPTMAQRREAKIQRMAKQIVLDNPQMKQVDADRVARMTVAQFPGIVAEQGRG